MGHHILQDDDGAAEAVPVVLGEGELDLAVAFAGRREDLEPVVGRGLLGHRPLGVGQDLHLAGGLVVTGPDLGGERDQLDAVLGELDEGRGLVVAVVHGDLGIAELGGVLGGVHRDGARALAGRAFRDGHPVTVGDLGAPVLVGLDVDKVVAAGLGDFLFEVFLGDGQEGASFLAHGDHLARPVIALDRDLVLPVVQEGVVVVLYADDRGFRLAIVYEVRVGGVTLLLADDAPVRVLARDGPGVGGRHQDGERLGPGRRKVVGVLRAVAQIHDLHGLLILRLAAGNQPCDEGCGAAEE